MKPVGPARDGIEETDWVLVIRRKNTDSPEDQQVYYTFPNLKTEWSTKDLYKKHPTLPDHWMYHGGTDNIIVFSNGEKLKPSTVEDALGMITLSLPDRPFVRAGKGTVIKAQTVKIYQDVIDSMNREPKPIAQRI
ncbi:hypothetical protein GE09DRAFT_1224624 [Coniochaeta sp. 2T2.1]|nr:hypothetical protein GE09DRAFT_1224624 [Coniochaeta sp. 2T2.1]